MYVLLAPVPCDPLSIANFIVLILNHGASAGFRAHDGEVHKEVIRGFTPHADIRLAVLAV